MKKLLFFILFLFLIPSCDEGFIVPKNVVIFGQSNAKSVLAYAIEDESNDVLEVKSHRHSGQPIATWMNDGIPGENIIDDLAFTKQMGLDFEILIWFQGESDRNNPELYKEDFDAWRDYWREKIGDHIIILILKVYALDGSCTAIRAVQQEIAVEYDDVYIIDTKKYNRFDNVHLTDYGFKRLASTIVGGLHNIYN